MITGAWKLLIGIVYNSTGSLFLGVYLYALLTLIETIAISYIIMYFVEKIRARKR